MTIAKLKKAIEDTGGQTALATRLTELTGKRVGQSHVSMWLSRKRVPPEWVIPIEKAMNGKIRRDQIRPDLYPPESVRGAKLSLAPDQA